MFQKSELKTDLYKSLLFILYFFSINFYSQVVIDSVKAEDGTYRLIKRIKKKPNFLFKNDSTKLRIRTIRTIFEDKLSYCYELNSITDEFLSFNEATYKVKTASFCVDKKINFKISLGQNIIKTHYYGDEKILVFNEDVAIKFYGFRKFEDEVNFFFYVKKGNGLFYTFYIRVFLIDQENIDKNTVFITYADILPSIKDVRSFCNANRHWNDLTVIPCKYRRNGNTTK